MISTARKLHDTMVGGSTLQAVAVLLLTWALSVLILGGVITLAASL